MWVGPPPEHRQSQAAKFRNGAPEPSTRGGPTHGSGSGSSSSSSSSSSNSSSSSSRSRGGGGGGGH